LVPDIGPSPPDGTPILAFKFARGTNPIVTWARSTMLAR
jgi:hypothetical protein